jgi:uncharacterized protein YcaQ
VAARDAGIRLYSPAAATQLRPEGDEASLDALIDFAVRKYAPLPAISLTQLIARLRYGAPQWRGSLRSAVQRAKSRLARAQVEGTDWFWPAEEAVPGRAAVDEERVRLLAPFDPVVWDRQRFELLWGWSYKFEAYTPEAKRQFGYYALPMLQRDCVIGWANVSARAGSLQPSFGYAGKKPTGAAFRAALDDEMQRMTHFLASR